MTEISSIMDESVKNIPRSVTSFSDIRYNDPWLRFDDGDRKSDIQSIARSLPRSSPRLKITDEPMNQSLFKTLKYSKSNEMDRDDYIPESTMADDIETISSVKRGNLRNSRLTTCHKSVLPQLRKSKINTSGELHSRADLNLGVYSLIDRGFIPPNSDMKFVINSATGNPYLRFSKARLHPIRAKLDRQIYPCDMNVVYKPDAKPEPRGLPHHGFIVRPISAGPDKDPPRNPCPSPVERFDRSIWSSYKLKIKHRVIQGTDDPQFNATVGWVLPFKDGLVFKEAPVYADFVSRVKLNECWLAMEWILGQVERFLQDYGINYADVNCDKLLLLCREPLIWPLKRTTILGCMANPDEIFERMHHSAKKFNMAGVTFAAVVIQKSIRRWLRMRNHLVNLEQLWAVITIKRKWIMRVRGRKIREEIQRQFVEEDTMRCVRLINNLRRDCIPIFGAGNKRIIIQVSNWRHPKKSRDLPDFDFARCFHLLDPDVTMLFLVPFIDPAKMNTLLRLFDYAYPDNNPVRNNRVHFIAPDISHFFPTETSMPTVALASVFTLKKIQSFSEDKDAILYTDAVGEREIRLSSVLKIPIYGCVPDTYDLLSSRGKSRKFFEAAGVAICPAILSTATDTTALLAHLLKAMFLRPTANYWAFIPSCKLNSDYPDGQMPTAFVDVAQLSFKGDPDLEAFCKSFATKQAQESRKSNAKTPKQSPKVTSAETELSEKLKTIGGDFTRFMGRWKSSKGFLQAIPCQDLRKMRIVEYGINVTWDGTCTLLVSTETLFNNSMLPCGFFIPQKQLSLADTKDLLSKVSSHITLLGMVGYFTIELMTWTDDSGAKQYWATNLKPYLSCTILRGQSVLLMSGCTFSDAEDRMVYKRSEILLHTPHLQKARYLDMNQAMDKFNQTRLPGIKPVEDRVAFYQDALTHVHIEIIGRRAATSFLEHQGLKYDAWTRTGTLFPTDEGLYKTSLPIISIGFDRRSSLHTLMTSVSIANVLLWSKKTKPSHNFLAITRRILYEIVYERFQSSKSESDGDLLQKASERTSKFGALIPTGPTTFEATIQDLDECIISDIDMLIAKYTVLPPFTNRLESPQDDDEFNRNPRMSATSIMLLAEGVPSNTAAELDPTFRKPIMIPPYKRGGRKKSTSVDEEASPIKKNGISRLDRSGSMANDTQFTSISKTSLVDEHKVATGTFSKGASLLSVDE